MCARISSYRTNSHGGYRFFLFLLLLTHCLSPLLYFILSVYNRPSSTHRHHEQHLSIYLASQLLVVDADNCAHFIPSANNIIRKILIYIYLFMQCKLRRIPTAHTYVWLVNKNNLHQHILMIDAHISSITVQSSSSASSSTARQQQQAPAERAACM